MNRKIKSEDVEETLREELKKEGYTLSDPKKLGETGVDILATKDKETFHIETIGYKSKGSARAKDFYEVFFRAVSRLNDGATHCVIALPNCFEEGLPARVKQHKIAWERIGKAFPELEIWLIDVDNKTYKRTKWINWVKNKSCDIPT